MPNILPQNLMLSKGYFSTSCLSASQILKISSLPTPTPACSKK